MPTSILIADNHPLIRKGLGQILKQETHLVIAGEANDGAEAIEKFEKINPDLTILDISMPNVNGIEAARTILGKNKNAKILFYSLTTSRAEIQRTYAIGGRGFLSKEKGAGEIIEAIKKVSSGRTYYENPALRKEIEQISNSAYSIKTESLSEKEKQILKFIAGNLSSKNIAANLNLSERSIEEYKKKIIRKLRIANHNELVKYAVMNYL